MAEPVVPKHDHATLNFPHDFLWGSATSAHQVEGNNIHNDWWAWEQKQPKNKRSKEACDHYSRFEEDFDLAKSLGHNAHRLSVEWSRIEPVEGEFDFHEIGHYKKVLQSLKQRGFTVMLTLHHFTNPQWLADKGGWENRKAPFYFERFVQKIVPELQDYVDMWVTINEPGIYVWMHYFSGKGPHNKLGSWKSLLTLWHFASGHKKAYRIIHKLTPGKMVGISQNTQTYDAFHRHSVREQLSVMIQDWVTNHFFYFITRGHHDFIGINYYFHHRLDADGELLPHEINPVTFSKEVSDLGWEIYPEGIFDILADMSDHLPIYITECGIATSNDDRRIRFLMQYLQEVNRAIKAGVDVRGFFYWSLLDNFEWADGFDAKFGLVEVDFATQKRTPRPSAFIYEDIIKHNGIRHDLMKFLGHRINAREVIEIPGVGKIAESKV